MDGGQNPPEDPRRLAELSALADGTLDPDRRAEVQARIDASEDLRRQWHDEQRAVALLTAARERDRAPAALRERIEHARHGAAGERGRSRRGARPAWRSPAGRLAGVGALVAVAVVLALVLPFGSLSTPSVAQAAALGPLGPTGGPPAALSSDPARLQLAVGRLHFPNWASTIAWRPSGRRSDSLDGRRVQTVYYTRAGHTVAYSIVSGRPLPWSSGAVRSTGPYPFQLLRLRGRTVVAWREAGHTCLLSAQGLPEGTLAMLIYHA